MSSVQKTLPEKKHGTRSSLVRVTELPPCKGPKLHRFKHHDSTIQWLERIDVAREDSLGIHAYVFKVEIDRKQYALKIFKPFDASDLQWRYETILGRTIDKKETTYHLDPFFAECRAYGRMKDKNCQKSAITTIVAPCHGFLFLTQADEDRLKAYNVDLETNNLGKRNFPRHPTPAIVKDLIIPGECINEKNASKILKGICALFDHGIFNRDIRTDNFVDGKLVDFGSSMILPHYVLDSLPERQQIGIRCADFVMFDDMIEENEIGFSFRAQPGLTDVARIGGKTLTTFHHLVSPRKPALKSQPSRAVRFNVDKNAYRGATAPNRKRPKRKRPR